ncbi:MAG: ribonuclease Y [Kiritimatiellae bacterium]|nr:ribonuclease Y [Kiritimatiellia bacterium]
MLELQIPWWLPTLTAFLGILMGFAAGWTIFSLSKRLSDVRAEKDAKTLLESAERDANHLLREAKIQAKDEVLRAQKDFNKEMEKHREQMRAQEERIARRETNLDRKVDLLDKKEQKLETELVEGDKQRELLQDRFNQLDEMVRQEQEAIQRVADLSREDARKLMMQNLEEDVRVEAGNLIRRIQEDTREIAEKKARDIIITAIQRYAADQAGEITTSTVHLPGDEMKGRIIGKEGRNIRSIEAATGVDILIDDTPEVVVISGFDPLRREIARIALERLLLDGRIHPARIEEVVSKVKEEVNDAIRDAGEKAIYELGIHGVDPELVRTLGRLKFRHSYGQNVLKHSIEMAHLMGMMAGDLKLDIDTAKRIGLFHDIGKALDHQYEGSHALIGAEWLRKYGEVPVVVNAVAAHHRDVEPDGPYAVLASAADAITASRPGARSETTEFYLKRLEKMEAIASSFRGVEKSYAIQAGREIRVIIEPSKIDDNEAMQLARNIAKQIQENLEYPGQIKVTVLRETRCVEYAR